MPPARVPSRRHDPPAYHTKTKETTTKLEIKFINELREAAVYFKPTDNVNVNDRDEQYGYFLYLMVQFVIDYPELVLFSPTHIKEYETAFLLTDQPPDYDKFCGLVLLILTGIVCRMAKNTSNSPKCEPILKLFIDVDRIYLRNEKPVADYLGKCVKLDYTLLYRSVVSSYRHHQMTRKLLEKTKRTDLVGDNPISTRLPVVCPVEVNTHSREGELPAISQMRLAIEALKFTRSQLLLRANPEDALLADSSKFFDSYEALDSFVNAEVLPVEQLILLHVGTFRLRMHALKKGTVTNITPLNKVNETDWLDYLNHISAVVAKRVLTVGELCDLQDFYKLYRKMTIAAYVPVTLQDRINPLHLQVEARLVQRRIAVEGSNRVTGTIPWTDGSNQVPDVQRTSVVGTVTGNVAPVAWWLYDCIVVPYVISSVLSLMQVPTLVHVGLMVVGGTAVKNVTRRVLSGKACMSKRILWFVVLGASLACILSLMSWYTLIMNSSFIQGLIGTYQLATNPVKFCGDKITSMYDWFTGNQPTPEPGMFDWLFADPKAAFEWVRAYASDRCQSAFEFVKTLFTSLVERMWNVGSFRLGPVYGPENIPSTVHESIPTVVPYFGPAVNPLGLVGRMTPSIQPVSMNPLINQTVSLTLAHTHQVSRVMASSFSGKSVNLDYRASLPPPPPTQSALNSTEKLLLDISRTKPVESALTPVSDGVTVSANVPVLYGPQNKYSPTAGRWALPDPSKPSGEVASVSKLVFVFIFLFLSKLVCVPDHICIGLGHMLAWLR
jgi:hypothetical protein